MTDTIESLAKEMLKDFFSGDDERCETEIKWDLIKYLTRARDLGPVWRTDFENVAGTGRIVLGEYKGTKFTMCWHSARYFELAGCNEGAGWAVHGAGILARGPDGKPMRVNPDAWMPLPQPPAQEPGQ